MSTHAFHAPDRTGSEQDPQDLRRELQCSEAKELQIRRAIVGMSLIGMASMAIVSLYQTGLIKHLPDPPIEGFDSDKVNASNTAYHWGVPDGTVSMTSHAADVALATFGDADRAEKQPWVPLFMTGKKAVEAWVAGRYLFYEMPFVEKAWCGYCITDAFMHLGTFALSIPEAVKAASGVLMSDGHIRSKG